VARTIDVTDPRFECTACGQCCTGNPQTHYVEVSRAEQKRICGTLGLSVRDFRHQYLVSAADGSEGIRLVDNGVCPFLQPDRRCAIYTVRPVQCETYPFWPELIGNREQWELEKQRCEGIGRGAIIPIAEIKARLAQMANDGNEGIEY
jgi:Fe-S-cluster containining protein